MQITNSLVCDTSMLYKQIKPRLVAEHALPLTWFGCKEAHVTYVLSINKKNSTIFHLKIIFFTAVKKYSLFYTEQ